MLSTLENPANHQSVKLANDINWLRVWDAERDYRPDRHCSKLLQATHYYAPVFGDRLCWKCDSVTPSHVSTSHTPT